MEPFVVLLGLATVAAGGAGGALLLLSPSSSAGDSGAAAAAGTPGLAVDHPAPGAVPTRGDARRRDDRDLDGGEGELVVRWRLPDGSLADTQSLRSTTDRRSMRAAIDLTFTGTDPVLGDVVAIVSPAGMRASAPIRYLCPSSSRKGADRSRDA